MDIPWTYYAGTQGKGYRNGLASAHLVAEALLGSQTHLQDGSDFFVAFTAEMQYWPMFRFCRGTTHKKGRSDSIGTG